MATPAPQITGAALAAQLLKTAQRSAAFVQAAQEAARRLQQGPAPSAPPAPPGGRPTTSVPRP